MLPQQVTSNCIHPFEVANLLTAAVLGCARVLMLCTRHPSIINKIRCLKFLLRFWCIRAGVCQARCFCIELKCNPAQLWQSEHCNPP